MNYIKYLIFIDILGFEKLAEEIQEKIGVERRIIRSHFIDIINEKVKLLEKKGLVIGKKYSESDDWILVCNSLNDVYKILNIIIRHNTGFKDFENIPIEIAVGLESFDEWAKLEGKELIVEDRTITFLKSDLLKYYKRWFKQKNNESIKVTYIVIATNVYEKLNYWDKKMCHKICWEGVEVYNFTNEALRHKGEILNFLEELGYEGVKLYESIDSIFVPPVEYQDILNTIRDKRVVFLTGSREYGKTFTAIQLLWEYYQKGYEIKWITGGEPSERSVSRKRLENIDCVLEQKRIIYFEDPFGKTKYEKREGLEREIGTIIDMVLKRPDAYVVITSREEVFKEFQKEQLSASDLKAFEKKMNIKKPSYDYEKRKQILLNWAQEQNCKWVNNPKLVKLTMNLIQDVKILPTPLSTRNFTIATANIEQEADIRFIIQQKSKETAYSFSDEINNLSVDKIIFLLLIFVAHKSNLSTLKKVYSELIVELNLIDPCQFEDIISWFKDDKVEVTASNLKFSHPSYIQAVQLSLSKDSHRTYLNYTYFNPLLKKLLIIQPLELASFVVDNYSLIESQLGLILLDKFVGNGTDASSEIASWILANNFNVIPYEMADRFLLTLSNNTEALSAIEWIIEEYYGIISQEVIATIQPILDHHRVINNKSEFDEYVRIIDNKRELDEYVYSSFLDDSIDELSQEELFSYGLSDKHTVNEDDYYDADDLADYDADDNYADDLADYDVDDE